MQPGSCVLFHGVQGGRDTTAAHRVYCNAAPLEGEQRVQYKHQNTFTHKASSSGD